MNNYFKILKKRYIIIGLSIGSAISAIILFGGVEYLISTLFVSIIIYMNLSRVGQNSQFTNLANHSQKFDSSEIGSAPNSSAFNEMPQSSNISNSFSSWESSPDSSYQETHWSTSDHITSPNYSNVPGNIHISK